MAPHSGAIHVIACNKRKAFVQESEAKQSKLPCGPMDCFASLAMTKEIPFIVLPRDII